MKLKRLPTVGLYVGSFNRFHIGHLDIARKAELIFDKVIVAQGINSDKPNPIPIPELEGIAILTYTSMTTDLVINLEEHGYNVTIVRGIRGGYDLDYETNQQRVWKDILPSLKIIMLRCDAKYDHISSSMIRTLEKIDKTLIAKYLP